MKQHTLITLVFSALLTTGEAVDFGVNCTGGNVQTLTEWEAFTGAPAPVISDNMFYNNWTDLRRNAANWIVDRWGNTPDKERFLIAVPMFPRGGTDFAGAVAGQYDDVFVECAQILIAGGFQDCTLRLGWEFNGTWSPWYAPEGMRDQFRTYWQRIHTAMMAQPGANFKWDWNVSVGDQLTDATGFYPGDDYVDFIGVDVYDTNGFYYFNNQNFTESHRDWAREMVFFLKVYGYQGMQFWREFAQERNKPFSISEWGLWETYLPNAIVGGNDNPYFIEQMYRWMTANDVHSACYFEVYYGPGEDHRLLDGRHPLSRERYREVFIDGVLENADTEIIDDGEEETETVTYPEIIVDGALSDWPNELLMTDDGYDVDDAGEIDIRWLYWTNDADNMFLGLINETNATLDSRWNLFIDTDGSNLTGYRAYQCGAEYLLRGNMLYQYTGTGLYNWSWQEISTVNVVTNGKNIEMSFPKSLLGDTDSIGLVFFGRDNDQTEVVPNNGIALQRDIIGVIDPVDPVDPVDPDTIVPIPARTQGPITVNGNLQDWSPASLSYSDVGEFGQQNGVIDLREIFMSHDSNQWNIAYRTIKPLGFSTNWMLFIDTDDDPDVGYGIFELGAEYLIRRNSVYRYTGNGSNWSWAYVGLANHGNFAQVQELSLPRTWIGNPASLRYIFFGTNENQPAETVFDENRGGIPYSFDD